MDTRLLELLVCHADRLAFPVRDGIPVMLESEARAFDAQGAGGEDPGSVN